MTLDLIFGVFFALMLSLGWRSGAMRQVMRVIAAVAVMALTAPASALVREALVPRVELAGPLVEVASMVLAALGIYVGLAVAGWLIIRAVYTVSDTLTWADRAGGAGLGALKSMLIIYVLVLFALLLQGPLGHIDPDDRLHFRDGRLTAFVERHDVLAPWRFPDVARLEVALRVAAKAEGSRRGAAALREHEQAADFVRREAFRALLEREALVEAARGGHLAGVLADEAARALINEPEHVEALRRVDWEEVEREVVGPREQPTEPGGDASGGGDAGGRRARARPRNHTSAHDRAHARSPGRWDQLGNWMRGSSGWGL